MPDPETVVGLYTRPVYLVSTLPPAASLQGFIRYVSDSTLNPASSSGTVVTGGGQTRTRVLSDGTNWRLYGWS